MDRVVVLTVDEVSVLIGLLDARWSGAREPDPSLADIATRYEQLLWARSVDVSDTAADRATLASRVAAAQAETARLRDSLDAAIADSRAIGRRNDELLVALRAAAEIIGREGPLAGRPATDGELADIRALLSAVTAA